MAGYIGSRASVVSSGAERKKTFDITGTTTVLTGLSYTPTFVHLFHNGVRLVDGTDYTATNGTSITLTTAAQSGDQVVVVSYATFQPSDTVSASAGGTFAGDVSVTGAFTSLGIDDNAAATAVTIDASGNVGIGLTAQEFDSIATVGYSAATHNGPFFADTRTAGTSVGGAVNLGGKYTAAGAYRSFGSVLGGKENGTDANSAGYLAFRVNQNSVNPVETMRIDSSGNVGIGTSSPLAALHVTTSTTDYIGDVMISGTRPYLVFDDTTAAQNGFSFGVDGGALTIGTGDFSTNTNVYGTECMRINASGNLLVGTTGLGNNSRIQILGASGTNDLAIFKTSTANGNIYFQNSSGVQVGYIQISASSTVYATSSDYRLKENITPVQGAADIVKAMQPVTYTFKSDGSWHDGFLAHELQELHPRAVIGSKDAMKDEEYEVTPAVEATFDAEGVELTPAVPAVMGTRSVPDYQGVDYSKLTPILTAALQEALNKIDALEARLTALEATP